jgi:transposase
MKTPLLPPPSDWREGRRFRAWELRQQGWTQQQIAAALGVSQSAVSRWLTRARTAGVAALRHRRAPGATPKLTPDQHALIPGLLARGAEAWGFRGQVWTRARVAEVIQRTFGVRYHPAHVSRLLRRLRWSPQKPIRRARQRKEHQITQWRETTAAGLKKRP